MLQRIGFQAKLYSIFQVERVEPLRILQGKTGKKTETLNKESGTVT